MDNESSAKTELQRLGRSRPASLSTRLVEIGFVSCVLLSMMMSEFFISGFNIVLPPLTRSLDIPPSLRTWPAAVPNLVTAALLLPCSRLCDIYGGKVVFLAGHGWLAIWSLVAGFAQNPIMLIVCRAMQGMAGAAFLPAGLALFGTVYRPGPRKNFVFSLYGSFAALGFYFGIIVGALAGELLSWRWYFWIGTILVVAVFVSGLLFIPNNSHDKDPTITMDWWGVVTVVPGLVLVVFAFTDGSYAPQEWRTPYIYVTLILGVLFLAAAVYVQGWVSKRPLMPSDVFKSKYMKRLTAALFCAYGVFGLFMYYTSFYLETVLHTTPLQTAAWFSPLAVGGMILSIVGGLLLHLLPGRLLMMVSCTGFVLSCLLFALIPAQEDGSPSKSFLYWAYVFPAMICGTIGVDICFTVTNVFITTQMPARLQATAGGLLNSLLYLGMAFWLGIGEVAVATTRRNRHLDEMEDQDKALREQYQVAFWVGVGLAALAMCLMATVKLGMASADMTADEKAQLERENSALRAADSAQETDKGVSEPKSTGESRRASRDDIEKAEARP